MDLRILCKNCSTEHRIPEESFRAGPHRFACKKCGQEIHIVRGPGGIEVAGGSILSPVEPFRPKQLGKYRDLIQLASGGMGDIYLAKQAGAEGFEKEVVLKVLHPHLARDDNFAKAMVDEAKITVLLNHPNIVQMYNLERIGDLLYCVMEYVPGKSLVKIQRTFRRKGGRIPVPMAVFIVMEALEGLAYAHSLTNRDGHRLNIVHRDISPSNIMVTKDGWVKIIDFGIAKAASRSTYTQPGTIKGKFAYMAPEQFRGKADHRADIFSMGVVLWETLAGVKLFYSNTDVDTLQKVLHLDPPPISLSRPEIPKNLDRILGKAMAKDPDYRYGSAAEFKADLLKFMAPATLAQLRASVDIEAESLGSDAAAHKVDITPVVGVLDMVEPPVAKPAPPNWPAQRGPFSSWWVRILLGLILLCGVLAAVYLVLPTHPSASGGSADAGTQPGIAPVPDLAEASPNHPDSGPSDGMATGGSAEPVGMDAGTTTAQAAPPKPQPPPPVKLTREVIGNVLRRQDARLQHCADAHLAKLGFGSDMQVILEFTIAANGHVQQAGLAPANLEATEFGRCVLELMRSLAFPRHLDKSVSIRLPLTFQVLKK